MIELFIYISEAIPSLALFLLFMGIGIGVLFFINKLDLTIDKDPDDFDKRKTNTFRQGIISIILLLVAVLLPSEKTMFLMLGSHYLKESEVPTKVMNVINKELDKFLNEDEPEKVKILKK